MPGVIAYIDHKDVPGKNVICGPPLLPAEEELFCSGKVLYNGQPVGLILAGSFGQALAAASAVKIYYEESTEIPLFTIKDVLKNNETHRIINVASKDRERTGKNKNNVVNQQTL